MITFLDLDDCGLDSGLWLIGFRCICGLNTGLGQRLMIRLLAVDFWCYFPAYCWWFCVQVKVWANCLPVPLQSDCAFQSNHKTDAGRLHLVLTSTTLSTSAVTTISTSLLTSLVSSSVTTFIFCLLTSASRREPHLPATTQTITDTYLYCVIYIHTYQFCLCTSESLIPKMNNFPDSLTYFHVRRFITLLMFLLSIIQI